MLSLGTESVLVGDVVDGVPDVGDRVDVGEATADGEALVLVAGVHQLGRLLVGLAVGELISELISVDADIVQRRLLHDHRLTVVWLRIQDDRRSREDDSDDGSKGNYQLHG